MNVWKSSVSLWPSYCNALESTHILELRRFIQKTYGQIKVTNCESLGMGRMGMIQSSEDTLCRYCQLRHEHSSGFAICFATLLHCLYVVSILYMQQIHSALQHQVQGSCGLAKSNEYCGFPDQFNCNDTKI